MVSEVEYEGGERREEGEEDGEEAEPVTGVKGGRKIKIKLTVVEAEVE